MNRFLFAKHAEDRAPSGCGPQARWLCCSLLTYRAGYASSLAPRQRAWGPAAECELISARTLSLALRNKYHQDTKAPRNTKKDYTRESTESELLREPVHALHKIVRFLPGYIQGAPMHEPA